MKRNMDLVRAILSVVENHSEKTILRADCFEAVKGEQFPGLSTTDVYEHILLMEDGGLVKTNFGQAVGPKGRTFTELHLAWGGHEFIANAKNDEVWEKAKKMAGGLSLAVLKQKVLEVAQNL